MQEAKSFAWIVIKRMTVFRCDEYRTVTGCVRQVLYKTVVLVLANKGQVRYNEPKWGAQMVGLRVDVIVLT